MSLGRFKGQKVWTKKNKPTHNDIKQLEIPINQFNISKTEISKTRRPQQKKNRYQNTKSNKQQLKLSEKTRYQKLDIPNSQRYQIYKISKCVSFLVSAFQLCVVAVVHFPNMCLFWCPLSKSVTDLVSTFQMCWASLLWCVGAFSAQALPVQWLLRSF